jgi:hypothetical protein
LAGSNCELTHLAKSILTHYFMEIFADQSIIKKFALLISTSDWGSYLTSVDCSLTLITEIGGMGYITESSEWPRVEIQGFRVTSKNGIFSIFAIIDQF